MTAPRSIAWPRPGYFLVRLVKDGPLVPARIWLDVPVDPLTGDDLDRSHRLMAEIDGAPAEIARVWQWGREVVKAEYDHRRSLTAWARRHAPDDPMANPRAAVDLNAAPTIF